jgi:hypothetical protein
MSEFRAPACPFVAIAAGNGTVQRAISLPPLTNEELKAEIMAPYAAVARVAADTAFLAAAFKPTSMEETKEYLRFEHRRAVATAVDNFRKDWIFVDPNCECELIKVASHAFYWRIDELARCPGLGGRA